MVIDKISMHELCYNLESQKFYKLEPSSFIKTTVGWTEAIPSYFIHACVY